MSGGSSAPSRSLSSLLLPPSSCLESTATISDHEDVQQRPGSGLQPGDHECPTSALCCLCVSLMSERRILPSCVSFYFWSLSYLQLDHILRICLEKYFQTLQGNLETTVSKGVPRTLGFTLLTLSCPNPMEFCFTSVYFTC